MAGYDSSKDHIVCQTTAQVGFDWNNNPQGLNFRIVTYDGGVPKLDINKFYTDPRSGSVCEGRINRMECTPETLRASAGALMSLADHLEAVLGS